MAFSYVASVPAAAVRCVALAALLRLVLLVRQAVRARRAARCCPPQVVLLLGGDAQRERLFAQLAAGAQPAQALARCRAQPGDAQLRPTSLQAAALQALARQLADPALPLLVSSGHGGYEHVLAAAGVPAERYQIDAAATDTVTNFTCLLPVFRRRRLRHVLVVTSDYHRSRAACLATLLLGGCGIASTLAALPSEGRAAAEARRAEGLARCGRDCARALLWLFTGIHGGQLGRWLHPERFHAGRLRLRAS